MEVPYKKKLVVDYLNEVDYSVDPYYVPSDFAFKFVTFIKMVNGDEGEENKITMPWRLLERRLMTALIKDDLESIDIL